MLLVAWNNCGLQEGSAWGNGSYLAGLSFPATTSKEVATFQKFPEANLRLCWPQLSLVRDHTRNFRISIICINLKLAEICSKKKKLAFHLAFLLRYPSYFAWSFMAHFLVYRTDRQGQTLPTKYRSASAVVPVKLLDFNKPWKDSLEWAGSELNAWLDRSFEALSNGWWDLSLKHRVIIQQLKVNIMTGAEPKRQTQTWSENREEQAQASEDYTTTALKRKHWLVEGSATKLENGNEDWRLMAGLQHQLWLYARRFPCL